MIWRLRAWLTGVLSSLTDVFVRWWREVCGPIRNDRHPTRARALMHRALLWTPVIVLALVVSGWIGFQVFTVWRARDLAAKALANAEAGQARTARLQIYSASSLRPQDPEVKRSAALIESRLHSPAAVAKWEALDNVEFLTPEEVDARAETMALYGDPGQFARAVAALEASGEGARAAELRSLRRTRRGDFTSAITELRSTIASGAEDPVLRLRLLELLDARHALFLGENRPSPSDLVAAREMTALIDGLAGTPRAGQALALGLAAVYFPEEKKTIWAREVWNDPSASNPALLPAADFLATSGAMTPAELHAELSVLHIGAPQAQRAAFAAWMLRHDMPEQALVVASSSGAAENEELFGVRVAALAMMGNWEGLYQLADLPSQAPAYKRLFAKARAAAELGRQGEEAEAVKSAMRAAAAEGRLLEAVQLADIQGEGSIADRFILGLCGEASTADAALRLARQRFGARGRFASLEQAVQAARSASPAAPSVRDYEHFLALLNGESVDDAVLSAEVAAAPMDIGPRFTLALALIKQGKGKEAMAVFNDMDIIVERLTPQYKAVVAAMFAATGEQDLALHLSRTIDPGALTEAEFSLIAPLLVESSPEAPAP